MRAPAYSRGRQSVRDKTPQFEIHTLFIGVYRCGDRLRGYQLLAVGQYSGGVGLVAVVDGSEGGVQQAGQSGVGEPASQTRSVDIPPSRRSTWPVTQLLSADNRKRAIAAASAVVPTLLSG